MWMWIIVLGSAAWVLFDAKSIGVRKGLIPGMGNIGPWGWSIVTALIWIVGFPMYLYYRGKFKLAVANENIRANPVSKSIQTGITNNVHGSLENLEKLGELKQKGLISETEFEIKKKQILGL